MKECEMKLILALDKYGNREGLLDGFEVGDKEFVFEDSLAALNFEMEEMRMKSAVGEGIVSAICINNAQNNANKLENTFHAFFQNCQKKFMNALNQWEEVFKILDDSLINRRRVKRDACAPKRSSGIGKIAQKIKR